MHVSSYFDNETVDILNAGGVGVGFTDTVYGLLASANNKNAVERVYVLKNRNKTKPCIVLISNIMQLLDFGVSNSDIGLAKPYWPAPITLVMNVHSVPEHLTRGGSSLGFRLPDSKKLRKLIDKTGPLIAPSANPESMQPALSLPEAKKYFKDKVDFYVGNSHKVENNVSTIIQLDSKTTKQIR